MKWSEEYLIGIPVIDAQHKRLFELIKELANAINEGRDERELTEILQVLDQYKTRHFQLEEKYMLESNYPGLAEQQEAHRYFGKRFGELLRMLASNETEKDTGNTIKEELSQWLTEHVTGLDVKFGKYYQSQLK
jgi:hemerythrin